MVSSPVAVGASADGVANASAALDDMAGAGAGAGAGILGVGIAGAGLGETGLGEGLGVTGFGAAGFASTGGSPGFGAAGGAGAAVRGGGRGAIGLIGAEGADAGAGGAMGLGAAGAGAGAGALGATGAGLAAGDSGANGSPRGPKRLPTSGGTSKVFCGGRRARRFGLIRDRISGKGNSIMVWSWLVTSRKVPGGEACRNSPNEIFTLPSGNWVRIFLREIVTLPFPEDLTIAAREEGKRPSTILRGKANVSLGPTFAAAAAAAACIAGSIGAGAGLAGPGATPGLGIGAACLSCRDAVVGVGALSSSRLKPKSFLIESNIFS